MKRHLIAAALSLALVQLSGCAHLTAMQSDLVQQVSAYEAKQEYGKALELIAASSPTHPQRGRLLQKRTQIEAKAKALEQAAIRRAGEMAAQNRWADALEVYRDALDKLPQSQALRTDLKEFRRRQAQRVEELQVDQLVAKARWIERSLPVQVALVNTDPGSWRARQQLDRLRDEASAVSSELTEIGLAALERNNLGVAGRTLPIASRLSPNPQAAQARDQLTEEEAAQLQATRHSQSRAIDRLRNQESRKLLSDYQQAYRAGDLRRARLLMTRLRDLDGDNPTVAQEAARLKSRLDATIKKHMDEGNSLYGRSKFEEAMASWGQVLELDPDNEQARTSTERAARVLDKLKQLREEQGGQPKAAGLQ